MEEERVLELTTDTLGERPPVEGRRRTLSDDHAQPPWEGLEDRMETPQEQQTVRQQHGNEESGVPIRDMELEGAHWSGPQAGKVIQHPGTGWKRQLRRPVPKGPKIEDRQTGRHSSGVTTEQIDDYGNHFFLRTRLPPP